MPSSDAKMTIETVSMNYRYASAWNEVNTRIAQRQNAVTIFVSLSTAIITVLITSARADTLINPNVFSLLLPAVSIVFGLLNYKHDMTIALLRDFLADCERSSPIGDEKLALIGYNNISEKYRPHADAARKFHDISCAILIVIFNGLGFIVAHLAFPELFHWQSYPLLFYFVSGVISLCLVMRSTFWPYRFD